MDDILLPEEIDDAMQADRPTPLEPSGSNSSTRLAEKYAAAERVFSDFTEGRSFLRRINCELLQRMCQSRDLNDSGTKNEMWERLCQWVSFQETIIW